MGAKAVLSGRVIQRGDMLVVAAELIGVARPQLWGERFNRKFSDIFITEEAIAGRVSESLRGKLTGEERRDLLQRSARDSEAYTRTTRSLTVAAPRWRHWRMLPFLSCLNGFSL